MEITAAMVKKLRDATGAGMMECKAALTESGGNLDEATTILRKRGLATATKKAGRSTNEGIIGHYIHMGGKIGVLVQYVRREDVPAEIVERERAIYRSQMEGQNKPAAVIDKIIEGKLGGFYEQVCLLDQPSVRDPKLTVGQLVQQAIAKMGENIAVPRFARFKLGESA